MFSEMVRLAASKGTQCLILTDRIELFGQTFKSLSKTGVDVQILNANTNTKEFNPHAVVTVAMVETIKRRLLMGFNPKLIIIDEAHKGNFNKVIEQFDKAKVIGATATPKGKHLAKYYDDIIETIDIPELITQGYLAPCKAYQMQDSIEGLKVKAGEYTSESLINVFDDKKRYIGVVEEWLRLAKDKKTIVFNVNIEHAEKMTREFNLKGINSYCITSKTNKADRDKILSDFSKGEFPVLNNCGILTTGYDEPSIEVVIMNRKTKSLPLWLQCCGRGSRIYPDKEYFTVLDFGRNHEEHGLWAQPREWKLKESKKSKEQAAPLKECPKCYAVNYASARICVICEHVFPVKKEKEVKGIMVEITSGVPKQIKGKLISECSIDELILLQKVKKYKAAFIWRVVRSFGFAGIEEYADKMNYTSGWVWKQKQDINNNTFTNFRL